MMRSDRRIPILFRSSPASNTGLLVFGLLVAKSAVADFVSKDMPKSGTPDFEGEDERSMRQSVVTQN